MADFVEPELLHNPLDFLLPPIRTGTHQANTAITAPTKTAVSAKYPNVTQK